MRWIIIIIVAAFALGGTLYLGSGAGTQTVDAGPPVAEVNGRPISQGQFQQAYANNVRFYSQMMGTIQGQLSEQIMYATLQDLVVDVLVREEARRVNPHVEPDEIEAELAELKAGFADDATYRNALARSGLNENRLRDLLREELAIQKLEQSVRDEVELSDEETADLDEDAVQSLRRIAEQERVQEWIDDLRKGAVIDIHNPQLLARHLVTEGDLEGAVEQYELALVTDPFNSYLYMSLGAVYEELDMPEEALAAYEDAAEMNDTDPMVHVELALVYRDRDRDDDAAEQLRVAAEMNPWDFQLQFALMQLFLEMDLPEDAQKAEERLQELQRLETELQQPSEGADDTPLPTGDDLQTDVDEDGEEATASGEDG